MENVLAIILFVVLVFGGPIGCIVKALLGIEQRRFLPKSLTDECPGLSEGQHRTAISGDVDKLPE